MIENMLWMIIFIIISIENLRIQRNDMERVLLALLIKNI